LIELVALGRLGGALPSDFFCPRATHRRSAIARPRDTSIGNRDQANENKYSYIWRARPERSDVPSGFCRDIGDRRNLGAASVRELGARRVVGMR